MKKLDLVKNVTSFIVGAGTTQIVRGFVQNNTSPKSAADQVALAGATFVLGSMAADATKKYTDRAIEDLADQFKTLRKKTT